MCQPTQGHSPMPSKNLRESLETLRKLTPRINAVTDLAAETVREVESFLSDECSAGIPARVLAEDYDPSSEAGLFLEYRRVGSRFRIAVVELAEDGSDEFEKPWTDCARTLKLKTFRLLPTLL